MTSVVVLSPLSYSFKICDARILSGFRLLDGPWGTACSLPKLGEGSALVPWGRAGTRVELWPFREVGSRQ